MKNKIIGLIIIIALFFMFSTGYSQNDSLIIAPEVMFNGGPLTDFVYFKPGRILDNNTIWFCGYKGSLFGNETYVFRSVDGGNTFTHNTVPIGGDARPAQIDAFDANIALVALATGEIYRTTDGGVNWVLVYSYTTSAGNEWFDGCRILNDSVVVAYGDGDVPGELHFVRSTDKGATWTQITGINYLGGQWGYYTYGLAACNVDESIWCTSYPSGNTNSYVFRSYDAGITWDSYQVADSVASNRPRAVAFTDDNNGLIEIQGGYLIKSTDGGTTWNSTNNPDTSASGYPNAVSAIPNTNIIICYDDVGVFYTTDLGITWGAIPTTTSISGYLVSGLFLNSDFGYVFTDAGEVLRFKDQLTSISDPDIGQNPEEFHLSQNYPNPFNPETQIWYTLHKGGNVNLVVYDLSGRKVRTIVNDNFAAGIHNVVWNGLNDSGQQVASGTYIYQLTINGLKFSKKMNLMK